MSARASGEDNYPPGRSEVETRRLIRQAEIYDLPLRRLFADAGLAPGMRVLDLGSGAGDVALTAAALVGPTGSVLGVDMNPAILQTARARAHAAGLANVAFVAGDLGAGFEPEGEFDALVGRVVLMYISEPAAALRRLVRRLRPGGIVAFTEIHLALGAWATPPSPLLTRLGGWVRETYARAGLETEMGLGLQRAFVGAGLPAPRMRAHALVGGGPDWEGYAWIAGVLRSLLPRIVELGIASAEEVGVETLAGRLRAEFERDGKAGMWMPMIDAWSPKPETLGGETGARGPSGRCCGGATAGR
jgi:SAM-dependent methyltransferase